MHDGWVVRWRQTSRGRGGEVEKTTTEREETMSSESKKKGAINQTEAAEIKGAQSQSS